MSMDVWIGSSVARAREARQACGVSGSRCRVCAIRLLRKGLYYRQPWARSESYFGWPARLRWDAKGRLPTFGRGPHPSAPLWLAVLLYHGGTPRMSGNRHGGMPCLCGEKRSTTGTNVACRLWSLSALVYTIAMIVRPTLPNSQARILSEGEVLDH